MVTKFKIESEQCDRYCCMRCVPQEGVEGQGRPQVGDPPTRNRKNAVEKMELCTGAIQTQKIPDKCC